MNNQQTTQEPEQNTDESAQVQALVMPFQLTDTISFDLKQAFGFEFGIGAEKKTNYYVGTIKLWVTMRGGEKICFDMGSVDCACGNIEQAKKEAKAKMKRINKKMQIAWARLAA